MTHRPVKLIELSPRELQAMRLIGGGLKPKDAAAIMGIGIDTMKDYTRRARLKLCADTTTQAAVLVAQMYKQ